MRNCHSSCKACCLGKEPEDSISQRFSTKRSLLAVRRLVYYVAAFVAGMMTCKLKHTVTLYFYELANEYLEEMYDLLTWVQT